MNTAIRVIDLKKKYGRRTPTYALRGATFDIPAGAISAVVGPNGAGKTTCFNLLLGLLHADDGTIDISRESRDRLAFLADRTVLDPFGSVRAIVEAHERIVTAADTSAEPTRPDLLEGLDVTSLMDKKPSRLS